MFSAENLDKNKLKTYFIQFRDTLLTNSDAVIFIRKNRLWEGFWRYGWVAKALVVMGVLLGLKFLKTIIDWWQSTEADDPVEAAASVGHLFQNMAFEGYDFLFVGGMKYVMMMLLEVVIFHMVRGTLEKLTGQTSDLSFQAFFNAQIRMIKVSVRSFVMENLFSIAIGIVFMFAFGFGFLKPVVKYIVHCYFLGFIVLDNFAEQYNYSIKDSVKIARDYIGVALALGLTANVLLLIPVIGVIIAPVVVAVTVTLVMYHMSDLHQQPELETETLAETD